MNFQRNKTRIIVAVTIGIIAFILINLYVGNMQKQLDTQKKLLMLMQQNQTSVAQVEYLTATKDLKIGDVLKEEDVKLVKSQKEVKNGLKDLKEVVGEKLLEDVKVESVLTENLFAKTYQKTVGEHKALKPSQRALTLDISNFQGLSNDMVAGKSVDMYLTAKDKKWSLSNVTILSCDSNPDKTPICTSLTKAKTVTLAIENNKITEVIESISQGKILLVLTNPNDKSVTTKQVSTNANQRLSKLNSNYSPEFDNVNDLPNLPSLNSPETRDLPSPFMPISSGQSIEVIQANTRTKVEY